MVINMKLEDISNPLALSREQMAEAVKAAPERLEASSETPYDPNDEAAVDAFWSQATVRMPRKRGKQKEPLKIPVSIRLNLEVVEYFKASGEGWQTRLNEVLQDYIEQHPSEAA